ncbi:MAG: biopolymer transporter Tol [Phycisphaerales bacterium]|nr:biopolymer transporter Tol [Phycisphaerales bacterium]
MAILPVSSYGSPPGDALPALERQLTSAPHGHLLTNTGVWSPDGRWIVHDVRSDPAGAAFDGTRIEKVNVQTGEVVVLYESRNGAHCGVATYSPVEDKVVFIHGPEHPAAGWQYGPSRRRGVVVDCARPGFAANLDACDLAPPFTPGALRGGSHVHVFSGDGKWVSFTYNDEILSRLARPLPGGDIDQRNVGVCVPAGPVRVSRDHPRNHDGAYFSVLVTKTTADPRPGSDDITKAFEDAWVGTHGYLKPDGSRVPRAIAFQGDVVTAEGATISEVFIIDLPDDLTIPGEGPLQGTAIRRPFPPRGVTQRRLTYTAGRKFPGIQGPRHWLRSAPDGSRIAFLMRDDAGIVQLWTVTPIGGEPVQVTRNPWDIASAFTWSPSGRWIAHVMDNSIFVTDVASGQSVRLTVRSSDEAATRPEAVVFSPDGGKIAYIRRVCAGAQEYNQVFVVSVEGAPIS